MGMIIYVKSGLKSLPVEVEVAELSLGEFRDCTGENAGAEQAYKSLYDPGTEQRFFKDAEDVLSRLALKSFSAVADAIEAVNTIDGEEAKND